MYEDWEGELVRSMRVAAADLLDKRAMGLQGVKEAAYELWPQLGWICQDQDEAEIVAFLYGESRPFWVSFPKDCETVTIPLGMSMWADDVKTITLRRPLMTTTGYALSWYPEYRIVLYVNDWDQP